MTSRGSDVINRCADSSAVDSPTRHFYFMTSVDDDVVELERQLVKEDQRSLTTEVVSVSQRSQTRQDKRHDDDDDDDDLLLSNNLDVNDETLCQADVATPAKCSSSQEMCRSLSRTIRPQSRPEQTINILATVEQLYNVAELSPPLRNISRTQAENIEEYRLYQQRHALPLTTDHRPISDENETENKIGFDRKLIDEIDAEMAQNGFKTSRFRTSKSTGSKHCVDRKRPPQGSSHRDHVTPPVKDGQGRLCDAEDSETKSRDQTAERRVSVIGSHRQMSAPAATDEVELTGDDSDEVTTSSLGLDQSWDTYQSPLYHVTAGDSDDEEKLDASVLLQRLHDDDDDDDVICVSSDQSLRRGSRRQVLALSRKSQCKQKDHVTCSRKRNNYDDSSSEADDFDYVISESRDALSFTRSAFNSPQHVAAVYEALATCRTNIDCLQMLLDALRATNQRHCVHELLTAWRQLDSDIQRLLQRTHSATFNATDELKVDLLQSTLNLTQPNWVTGSNRSRDSCHVQLTGDDSGFVNETPIGQCKQRRTAEEKCGIMGQKDCDVESLMTPLTLSTPQRVRRHLRWSRDTIPAILLVVAMLSMTLMIHHLAVTCDVFVQPQLRYVMGPPPS